jgi:hypothetical protein
LRAPCARGQCRTLKPVVVKRILYELERRACSHCRKSFQSQAPGVLPKAMLGHQLLREIVSEHYLQGVPLSRITRRCRLKRGDRNEELSSNSGKFIQGQKKGAI